MSEAVFHGELAHGAVSASEQNDEAARRIKAKTGCIKVCDWDHLGGAPCTCREAARSVATIFRGKL